MWKIHRNIHTYTLYSAYESTQEFLYIFKINQILSYTHGQFYTKFSKHFRKKEKVERQKGTEGEEKTIISVYVLYICCIIRLRLYKIVVNMCKCEGVGV